MPPPDGEGKGKRAEQVDLCTSWRGALWGGGDRPRSRSLGARPSPSLERTWPGGRSCGGAAPEGGKEGGRFEDRKCFACLYLPAAARR
jgi:hypothetical protein